ncbi:MAG: alpha-glucuronidase family glycosyl hydrolase [Bacteroidales bacterium]
MMKPNLCRMALLIVLLSISLPGVAEDGYQLWLRYARVGNPDQANRIENLLEGVILPEAQAGSYAILREELSRASRGMLGREPVFGPGANGVATLVIGTPADLDLLDKESVRSALPGLGNEGYVLERPDPNGPLLIVANTPIGALYGTFHLLRNLQAGLNPADFLPLSESPRITRRILNHWDNLDRTVERGYAGFSIWDWHRLPGYLDTRYADYARANASVGINGTVLTNVNANALVLTPPYIEKAKALADLFRPYGIRVYLTARFNAPMELGDLETADPLDERVRTWWKNKADEIYEAIPDFGGFLVKANSEGQPGPQNFGRTHADGANLLADAVAPHGGIVMWRAFVYSADVPVDRAKQAYDEFVPLDGSFRDNVFIQVKNGPIDFQPREPFHPLFGAMEKTPLALEVQITQEYLGQATNLVSLASLFEDCLDAPTHRPFPPSTVASVIDGSDYGRGESVMAGVSNVGTDRNWTGHPFGQLNWFAFGRLAWDPHRTSGEIHDEWTRLTFGTDAGMVAAITELLAGSWETAIRYSTPLGLHHLMGRSHHYGPGPWVEGGRPDWTAVYYHRADTAGIGFDRTRTGSRALDQYAPEVAEAWSDPRSCPERYLLWFHRVEWTHPMGSGRTLWDELCLTYDRGVKEVGDMRRTWAGLEGRIDPERFGQVSQLLAIQEKEAQWWKNSCLLYFQTFSRMDFPPDMVRPEGDLEEYKSLQFPYAPGIQPSW